MDRESSSPAENCRAGRVALEIQHLLSQIRKDGEKRLQLRSIMEQELQRLRHDKSFHKFSQLPPEIRFEIWQHLVPPPRIVPVGLRPANTDRDARAEEFFLIDRHDGAGKVSAIAFNRLVEHNTLFPQTTSRVSRPRLPAIAHACQESRQIVIGTYESCFDTHLAPTSTVHKRSFLSNLTGLPILSIVPHRLLTWTGVRCRPQEDIIYLQPISERPDVWDVLRAATADELNTANIRRLIIDITGFEQIVARLMRPSPLFPRLLELFVTARDNDPPSGKYLSSKEIDIRAQQAVLKHRQHSPGAKWDLSHIKFLPWPVIVYLRRSGEWCYPKGRLAATGLPRPRSKTE